MNVLQPDSTAAQQLIFTPREVTAGNKLVQIVEDGTRKTALVSATATVNGSFMTINAVFNLQKNKGYAFKVFNVVSGQPTTEIYRGKLSAATANEPLKNSIYE